MRRKIIYMVLAVVLLAGGATVCIIRWQAWFGNPPEQDYAVAVLPHNVVLTYGAKAAGERVVSLCYDTLLQPSEVEIRIAADTLRVASVGRMVESRAGKAVYYRAVLPWMQAGRWIYRCRSGAEYSDWYNMTVSASDTTRFLLFGDVQDLTGRASAALFDQAFLRHPDVDFAAFAGDVIERPTDMYWQVWLRSMHGRTACYPVVSATGNHEYLKGVRKELDPRWTAVFPNPDNGPKRFQGRSFYIDFPAFRLIVIDTDGLTLFSDYTQVQTWLAAALREAGERWRVVMMHHPVYSAGKGRDNPLIWLTFRGTLREADVVFCGHDHNYMRRGTGRDSKGRHEPVYVLTNASEKTYAPKDTVRAEVFISGQRFYEYIKVSEDSLTVETRMAVSDSTADRLTLRREGESKN